MEWLASIAFLAVVVLALVILLKQGASAASDRVLVDALAEQNRQLCDLTGKLSHANINMTEQGFAMLKAKLQAQVDIARAQCIPDQPRPDITEPVHESGVDKWADTENGPN